jgi:hypothetical protein
MFVFFGSVFFAYVTLRNDFIYTRIDGEEKAAKVVLFSDSLLWSIARLFEKASLFLFGVLLFSWFFVKKSRVVKAIGLLSMLVFLAVFGFYFLVNSRLYFAFLLVLIFSIYVYKSESLPRRAILLLLFVCMTLFYSFKVVSNIRDSFHYNTGQLAWINFKPWHVYPEIAVKDSVIKRMDGIDLMAQISQNLSYENISLGKAWANPVFMLIAPAFYRSQVKEIKLQARTGAKNYLMEKLTSIKSADYYSCMLTDVYGNFWIFGFVLAAFVLARICSYVDNNLNKPRSSVAVVVSVYLMSIFLSFEQEFVGAFMNFVQLSPFLLLVLVVNPVRVHKCFCKKVVR